MAEPAEAAAVSTLAAKTAAFAASAPSSAASAAAGPLSAGHGHGWPVHEHVLCLLLQWVLRTLHVLLGPKC